MAVLFLLLLLPYTQAERPKLNGATLREQPLPGVSIMLSVLGSIGISCTGLVAGSYTHSRPREGIRQQGWATQDRE